ncbi:hypothetical protein PHLGIDRAFT_495597 [Phlebiopsis gigantea 11061_1 CR5-6]|uniref:Uncharacterized protein n=1 Tax=Phlebiopsis gigantea (strain 11061_1 CR5-6) TaxID=745531 RepID=A0A0C3S607_PHLG1|nr:hypothetical protein PHLGIDRAFT_495597 [Phlebiopsis gigantea 11061_1 CR5-6]
MPQIYRRHSEYTPRTVPQPSRRQSLVAGPQLTDADDAIVLSDLVRTGEASRLRRRGAMRLDHTLAATTRPPSAQQQLPPITLMPPAPRRPFALPAQPTGVPLTPTWGSPDAAGDEIPDSWQNWGTFDEPLTGSGSSGLDEQRRSAEHEDDEESFILYCGGAISKVPSADCSRPFEPSPLALPRSAARKSSTRPNAPRTNGCGTVVHLRAYSQKPRGVFVGKQQATDAVVPMDAAYFERSVVTRMMKSACGCVREGVGCSVCGNPLGTRYAPCQAASEGIFKPRCPAPPRAARPRHPAGPAYWDAAHGSQRAPPGAFFVHTFFADHVSSSPACAFPPTERAEHAPPPPPARTETWLGYTPAASPRPYSPAFAPNPSTPEPVPAEPLGATRRMALRRADSIYEPAEGRPLRRPAAYGAVIEFDDAAFGLEDMVSAPRAEDRLTVDVSLRGGLDADGVRVDRDELAEPGSPDKNESMVWPGR